MVPIAPGVRGVVLPVVTCQSVATAAVERGTRNPAEVRPVDPRRDGFDIIARVDSELNASAAWAVGCNGMGCRNTERPGRQHSDCREPPRLAPPHRNPAQRHNSYP